LGKYSYRANFFSFGCSDTFVGKSCGNGPSLKVRIHKGKREKGTKNAGIYGICAELGDGLE